MKQVVFTVRADEIEENFEDVLSDDIGGFITDHPEMGKVMQENWSTKHGKGEEKDYLIIIFNKIKKIPAGFERFLKKSVRDYFQPNLEMTFERKQQT